MFTPFDKGHQIKWLKRRNYKNDYRMFFIYLLCFSEIALYHYEADPAIKESRKEPLFKETIPFYLQRLDGIAKKNNGHLAVGRVSFFFVETIYTYIKSVIEPISNFHKLNK